MKRVGLFILIVIILALVGMGVFINQQVLVPDKKQIIYDGVFIENVDLSGLTKNEALQKLDEALHTDGRGTVHLVFNGQNYSMSYEELGFSYNPENLFKEAYQIGREGGIFERLKTVLQLQKEPVSISLESSFNMDLLHAKLEEIAEEINQEPINASINISNGEIQIEPSQKGYQMDVASTKDAITNQIGNPFGQYENIEIPVAISDPEYTEEYFQRINGIIGEFSTSFAGSIENRKENIRISTSVFNHRLLMPGEVISFNETTGPRSAENGYQSAGVIVGNRLESGLGGGVCQTSTTFYNAALRADLEIVERRAHTMPVGYVERGTDGAVAYGALDLKIKNPFDFPIYILAFTSGDQVTFQIYGDRNVKDYDIGVHSELVGTYPGNTKEVYDASAEPGSRTVEEQGRTGYKYNTFKTISRNGEVIDSSLISSDYYPPSDTVVIVGPEVPEEPEIQEAPQEDTPNENDEIEVMSPLEETTSP